MALVGVGRGVGWAGVGWGAMPCITPCHAYIVFGSIPAVSRSILKVLGSMPEEANRIATISYAVPLRLHVPNRRINKYMYMYIYIERDTI